MTYVAIFRFSKDYGRSLFRSFCCLLALSTDHPQSTLTFCIIIDNEIFENKKTYKNIKNTQKHQKNMPNNEIYQ